MKNKNNRIFICMLLFVSVIFSIESQEIWLEDSYLVSSESNNESSAPVIVVDSARNVHIAWTECIDYIDYYIFYKCIPHFYTWENNHWDDYPTELVSTDSEPGVILGWPTMYVEDNGTIHIAWKDGTDLNDESDNHADIFYKQKMTGGDWSDFLTEQVSIEDEERCNNPTLVVDSEGTVHIVWISNDYQGYSEMQYNYRPIDGEWTDTSTIGSRLYDYEHPDLAIDQFDKLHLVYSYEYTESLVDRDIGYKNKPFGGSWSGNTIVSDISSEDSKKPKLALSIDDPPIVHVTWVEEEIGDNDEIYYRECEPVWNPVEYVTDTTHFCCNPSISVRPYLSSLSILTHQISIAYSECVNPSSGKWVIQYKWKNAGNTWPGSETTLSNNTSGMADNPVLFTEPGSVIYWPRLIHCAWVLYSGSGNDRDIMYKCTYRLNCADVNNDYDINIVDALHIAQYYVGLINYLDTRVADVNCDRQIDIMDALLIAQMYVGLISSLNCCDTPISVPTAPPEGRP